MSLEHERRALAELEQRQPEPLSGAEREALARHTRELPRLWDAPTTTPRERKELLRTLIVEVVVTVHADPRRACVEIRWEGGARSELTVPLTRGGRETGRTSESTIELIRRLARHHPDHQIAAILNKQRRRTGTGLQFTEARVAGVRERAGIPIAPPPDLAGELHTVEAAARELGVAQTTIYRWLKAGLLPGEQTTPHAPGGSGSPTTSAADSSPTSPTDTYHSIRPPSDSASLARPFCTRSNAASCTPSRSRMDGETASESGFPTRPLDCLINDDPRRAGEPTPDGVEPTNNPAERALRSPVIHRKLSLGTQSHTGERFAERALSAAVTCRMQRRSLFTYLSELLAAHNRGDPFPRAHLSPGD